ncbi:MAG: PD40 domain-containing protein [Deltaproteobacteria bacterium]|nr:PD40 domain-containing protein [Deltaproteobacteria bacterium]
MHRRSLWLSLLFSFLAAFLSFQGCSASSGSKFAGSGTGTDASGPTGGGGDCLLCGTGGSGGGSQQGVIVVTPATVELTVKGGAVQTQVFKATLDGTDVTSQVTWVVEKPDVASINAAGVFTPTGKVGGVTKVLALLNKTKGEALATVSVELVFNTGNLSPTDQQLLDGAQPGGDPNFRFTYPLDKVVMPLRTLSPEFMWDNGKPVQAYRLKLTSKNISYVEYFGATNPGLKTLDQKQWEDIQFSGGGPVSDPLKVELARLSNGVADAVQPITVGIAQGIVYGSVYYWQLPLSGGQGKILRIKPSSEVTDEFFTSGECWGCHSVSRDGTNMMATFEVGAFNGFPLQTINLSTTPAQLGTIQTLTGLKGTFSAFNDDGSKIAYSNNFPGSLGSGSSSINIIDAVSGAQILPNAMPPGCGEPTWSPDGKMLAGICGMSGGGWTFDSFSGDLTVALLNQSQNQVVSQKVIVPKGNLTGRPAYPTFTPDSKYLIYGRPEQGSRSDGNGTLWMTDVDGLNPVQLTNASLDNRSFNPVSAPKSAGGYTWIVFISKRDYGHKLVSADRQQLWMVAIDDPPTPGTDPSHPPFYLRGQIPTELSENAYYALDPCKKDGESCEHGVECCNKSCIYDDGQKQYICKPAEGGECIPTGSGPCKSDTDCCDFSSDVLCLNGFCELKPPK